MAISLGQEWFIKYQRDLLKIANSQVGRFLLGINDNHPIVKLSHNSFIQLVGYSKNEPLFTGKFYCYGRTAKILLPILWRSKIARSEFKKNLPFNDRTIAHFSGLEHDRSLPQILLTVTNFYCAAGDGRVQMNDGTFSTARNAATGVSADTSDPQNIFHGEFSGAIYYFSRGFFPADTSAITSAASISAASLNFYATAITGVLNNTHVLCPMTAADPTVLATGDYDGYDSLNTPAEWANRFTSAAVSTSTYNVIDLNATGLAGISKTAYTNLGTRTAFDVDNSAPLTELKYITVSTSEHTGTSQDPYIQVSFTLGSKHFALLGVG